MSKLLPDATNFQDMESKTKPSVEFPHMTGPWVLCPKCFGYGGWNLELNAYPDSDLKRKIREDIVAAGVDPDKYLHKLSDCHFRASCFHCNGWGWVKADGPDVHCIHDFKEISAAEARSKGKEHWGMCWHVVECMKCGRLRSYDSSG